MDNIGKGFLNKFKFTNSKTPIKRSQSFETKHIDNKRQSLEKIAETFVEEEDSEASTLDISIQDIEMTNEQQKDYQGMILHISNNHIFSATVTPRDRKEIQNGIPAWNSWIITLTGKAESGSTKMPEAISNYFKQQIELYFIVVVRGWNVPIQAKEHDLYATMGMNHITETKKEPKEV